MSSYLELTKPVPEWTMGTRPSDGGWVGRFYYDPTLNKPYWWTGSIWVDWDGIVDLWPDTYTDAFNITNDTWYYGRVTDTGGGTDEDWMGVIFFPETNYYFDIEWISGTGQMNVQIMDDTGSSAIDSTGMISSSPSGPLVVDGSTPGVEATQPMYIRVLPDSDSDCYYRIRLRYHETHEANSFEDLRSNSPRNNPLSADMQYPGNIDWFRWECGPPDNGDWEMRGMSYDSYGFNAKVTLYKNDQTELTNFIMSNTLGYNLHYSWSYETTPSGYLYAKVEAGYVDYSAWVPTGNYRLMFRGFDDPV